MPAILAKKAFGGQRGARDLRNLIRRRVEDQIASLMVEHCDEPLAPFVLAQMKIFLWHALQYKKSRKHGPAIEMGPCFFCFFTKLSRRLFISA